ncbi:MAG TPA: NUDIX domain-containing protein [Alphaproteobacteria bacterium]|nr:NUDIX domain-containing protein [Alphaproteobacteria bacterium]
MIAVVRRGDQVLLAQRSRGTYTGKWGFPGGHVERGETIVEAGLRELAEETGVVAAPRGVLGHLDVMARTDDGAVLFHYVLLPVLADWISGEGVAADDAAAVRWITLEDMAAGVLPLLPDVERIAREALSPQTR